MNSRLKTTLLVLFALTTIATGILAWQQNRALRSTQVALVDTDRTALKKRLADAEHRAHALQNELDALKAKTVSEDAPSDEPPSSANNNDRRGPRGFDRGPDGMMALMNDPKVVQLMNSREKLMLDSRYAALFKSLVQGSNLTPQQIDAFKDLLVEKQNTTRDVMMSARAEGVTDRSEINKLVKNAQAELDAQIQSTLGASGFAEYQQYEKTAPQRNLVNQLTQSLSYTNAPLSDSQSKQLVQILADTTSSKSGERRNPVGFGGGPGGGSVTITDAAINQAQTVLTQPQLQALTTLQQQQKAQEEMRDAIRAARQNTTVAAPSSTTKVAK